MRNMFANATIGLTLIYMGILTLICLFFSYNWYEIATSQLDQSAAREKSAIERIKKRPLLFENPDASDQYFDEILRESKQRYKEAESAILGRIIATNLIIISSGTLGSYFLARKSLDPIEKVHQEQLRFTADASHELRTPLAAMQAEIEVALRDKKLTKKEAVDILKSNMEEIATLSGQSEGLLKLARQEESVGVELKNVSLEAMIKKAVERTQKQARHKKVELVQNVRNRKVVADFDTITELLVILIDNAIKYSPEKSKVHISTSESKGYVSIAVKDDGIGIRPSDLDHVFDRFYRADNSRSSQNVSGHGLGLSIAKNIADIHDARLSVESDGANLGTKFQFRLKKA